MQAEHLPQDVMRHQKPHFRHGLPVTTEFSMATNFPLCNFSVNLAAILIMAHEIPVVPVLAVLFRHYAEESVD